MLDAVERVRETLTAGAAESEERGTLDQVSVDALYRAGLFSFTTASELGGEEVDPLLELEVTEAACRIEPFGGLVHVDRRGQRRQHRSVPAR